MAQNKQSERQPSSVEMRPCACGCGEEVRPPSLYRPGHDSRRKSALINLALGDDPKVRRAAEKELADLGWQSFLDKSRASRAAKTAKKADAAKAKAEREAAKDEAA